MSLIICPECKSKISEYAEWCPHCGCPKHIIDKLLAAEIDRAESKRTIEAKKEKARLKKIRDAQETQEKHEKQTQEFIKNTESRLIAEAEKGNLKWRKTNESKDKYNMYIQYEACCGTILYTMIVTHLFYNYENKKSKKIEITFEFDSKIQHIPISNKSKLYTMLLKKKQYTQTYYEGEGSNSICTLSTENSTHKPSLKCVYCGKRIPVGNICYQCLEKYEKRRNRIGGMPAYDPNAMGSNRNSH